MKFDFKDLMAFGMFILALLTFILNISQKSFLSPGDRRRKTTLVNLAVERVAILSVEYSANLLCEVVVPFLLHLYYNQSISEIQSILRKTR